jgi:hypothetical protein
MGEAPVEILLVEDDPNDVEPTFHALPEKKLDRPARSLGAGNRLPLTPASLARKVRELLDSPTE